MTSEYEEGHYDSDEERRKLLEWDSYYGKHGIAGVYGQDKVKCQPFSTSTPDAFDPLRRIKVELKSLLITSGPLTPLEILIEFRDTFDFDIEDHGYSTVEELLADMSDAIVKTRDGYGNVIYMAYTDEKSADINSLIQRTKAHRPPGCSGVTRVGSIPRTSATVADLQPKSQRCRMSWLDRVPSTKTIGNFSFKPRKDPRPLLGKGPRSEERCVMVMDMVREIGQPSPDGMETRVHLENLVNFYYKETGVCLLGKIYAFENYLEEMKHPDFARFWRLMFDVQQGKDPLCFVVVPSVGFYPEPDPCDCAPAGTSPHDGSTVDNSYDGQVVEEGNAKDKRQLRPPRLASAGLQMFRNTVKSAVSHNLRDCAVRDDDKPCNRLPMSREDLRARRVTTPLPVDFEERSVAPATVNTVNRLDERCVEWMKEAKVIEIVKEGGPNLIASMFFVPPRSMIMTAAWGNHNFERFNFIENQLRDFAEAGNLKPAGILRLGQEYVTSSDGRLGRAIFVKHSDGGLLSFVLLDYHALVKVQDSDVFEMPSMFSSRSVPTNAFLASIRGVLDIPARLYDDVDAVITPDNDCPIGEVQIGEIFNIDQGRIRLVDWICASNTDQWFSDCCHQEGATEDPFAPKKVSFDDLHRSIEFLKEEDGFAFDPELEEVVYRAPHEYQNETPIAQITSQMEAVQIHRAPVEHEVAAQGGKRAVRFSDLPDDLFHYTLDTETGSQKSTSSSTIAHKEGHTEPNVSLSQRVRSLLQLFILLHCKDLGCIPDIKNFSHEVFQTVIPDPLLRQFVLSRFLSRLYFCKSMWKDSEDQHSLDFVASIISSWLAAEL